MIRTLPHGNLSDILGDATPIILAPHPDDEVIGCGGLIAAAVQARIAPAIVFVTDGSGSHPRSQRFPRNTLIALRQQEAYAAAQILGVDRRRLHFMRIADTAAPHDGYAFDEAIRTMGEIVASYKRPIIFAPWAFDPHGDHQAVHKMGGRISELTLVRHFSYLVWGWTLPPEHELGDVQISGWRFCLGSFRDVKSRALQAHRSQVSDLIDDDPTGFRLGQETLDAMLSDGEVFLLNA